MSSSHSSKILSEFSLQGVAELIRAGTASRIVVMSGAGVSTSAGIPDFRTRGSGLYARLAASGLKRPEDIFSIDSFKSNPRPFYALAQVLYPGAHCPTRTHAFIKLLADKGILLRNYTQNVDTLERVAGIPDDLVIEAHGSFHSASCTACGAAADTTEVREHVMRREVFHCPVCGGVVKPDIVFFGEDLPEMFMRKHRADMAACDLLIIIGTSLNVVPFAHLMLMVPPDCPRVLVNMEHAGALHPRGPRPKVPDLLRYRLPDEENHRDVGLLGKCDQVVSELCEAVGWLDDLIATEEAVKERFEEQYTELCRTARQSGVDFSQVLQEAVAESGPPTSAEGREGDGEDGTTSP